MVKHWWKASAGRGHRKAKRLLGALVLCLSLGLLAAPVYGLTEDQIDPYNHGYRIDRYLVEITVNDDNSYDITETITCFFDEDHYKHGIIRSIPLRNYVERPNGTGDYNRARVTDIHVSGTDGPEYSVERYDSYCDIRIGSADIYVAGEYTYEISYHYAIGRDPLRDMDEIYLNIIGDQWDTSIGDVEFAIHLPEDWQLTEADVTDWGFSSGGYGSTANDNVYHKWEGNDILGYDHEGLGAYEALTFRMELPEGTFVYPKNIFDTFGGLFSALPFVGLLAGIVLYLKKGRNEKPVEPVEFYPPDGMNPLDVGYYYDGTLDNKDISAMLIYLASKGYLQIEEVGKDERDPVTGKKARKTDGDYRIRLLKEIYEGDNAQESIFFDGLVDRSRDGIVREEDLEESFYKDIDKIRSAYRKRKYYEPVSGYRMFNMVGGFLLMWLATFLMFYKDTYYTPGAAASGLGIAVSMAFYLIFFGLGRRMTPQHPVVGWLIIIGVGLHMFVLEGGILAVVASQMGNISNGALLVGLLGIVSGFIMMFLGTSMRKRTAKANALLGKIRGFRTFLEKAEKPRLEMLVEENPSYFYDILPYTYVLGISSKWIKKFDSIVMEPPSWYIGTDTTDWRGMTTDIGRSMNQLGSVMRSSPASDGGGGGGWSSDGGFDSGGSSGGGFSGGGSGGGGGSSW